MDSFIVIALVVLALVCLWAFARTVALGRAARPDARPDDAPSIALPAENAVIPASVEPAPVLSLPPVLPVVRLTVHPTDGAPHETCFQRAIIKLGKDPKAHLKLHGDMVFRNHAVIEVEAPDSVRIIDLGTPGGTRLNGVKVHHHAQAHGDTLELGGVRITVSLDDAVLSSAA